MDFFQSHDSLSLIEWVIRAIITFFFMIIAVKVMGQRAISQLRLLDFVIALMLGNIIAHPLSDPTIGMEGSFITTIVLVAFYIFGILLSLKWPVLRKITDSAPFPLIKEGKISYQGLKKARISIDYLLAELRKEKIEDVKKVALALWESDGKMSVFLDSKYEAITPESYHKQPEPFDLPRTIIKEGKIDFDELNQLNLNEDWLINALRSSQQTVVSNVLLATIDCKRNLNVFFYK